MDIVVVYKVDRLTRSLADFARLVELFDAESVSFVSVTQQFNTTNSAACAGSRRRPTVSHEMQHNGDWHRARRQTLLARSSPRTALERDLHRPDCAQGSPRAAAGTDRR
jgi:Resolvase, N terminal domain